MSHNIIINAIGIFGALFFASISFIYVHKITMGFKDMFDKGIKI